MLTLSSLTFTEQHRQQRPESSQRDAEPAPSPSCHAPSCAKALPCQGWLLWHGDAMSNCHQPRSSQRRGSSSSADAPACAAGQGPALLPRLTSKVTLQWQNQGCGFPSWHTGNGGLNPPQGPQKLVMLSTHLLKVMAPREHHAELGHSPVSPPG